MEEVLSQSEIDMLLNALTSGQLDTEEIKEAEQVKPRAMIFAVQTNFPRTRCDYLPDA